MTLKLFCVLLFAIAFQLLAVDGDLFPREEDVLRPYLKRHVDQKRNHRHVRECQHVIHGNKTFEVHYGSNQTAKPPIASLEYLMHKVSEIKNVFEVKTRYVHGHIAVINNPAKAFSVLYPKMELSCSEQSGVRETTSTTAKVRKCLLATNGGFFNTHSGGCLGNIVSNGHLVHNSKGIQNANFGIRKDGSIVTGYLPEDEVVSTSYGFQQLISGVGWLIRNDKIYINESKKAECADTEETGTMERFFDVTSARTAIGHDKYGRVIIAQIDGKTNVDGLNLLEFAKLLKKHGAVNAINLDGGGSATFVVNGTVVNYPSDICGKDVTCERKISSIICIHEPEIDCKCSDTQSKCINGVCVPDNVGKKSNRSEHANVKKKTIFNFAMKDHNKDSSFDPELEDQQPDAANFQRSFVVVWFVALSAVLGCSLLGNVFLVNMIRSQKRDDKSWQKSDLRALLAEDSDGV